MPQQIEFDFSGINVVITGASGGIGAKIAKRFLEAGANLFLHSCRNEQTLQTMFGKDCPYCVADFSKYEERQRFYGAATLFFPKIDIWINTAGLDLMSAEIKQLPFNEKLKQILETDVIASVEFAKRIAIKMKEQGGGTIFFFGWDGVDFGWGGETAELYGIAKGALQGFCKCFAVTVSPEVKVRLMSPGWIETRWGKQASEEYQKRIKTDSLQSRWGMPDDVAAAVLFFASKESAYIDCNPVYINGGKRGTK